MQIQKFMRLWTPFLFTSALTVLTQQFLTEYFRWADAVVWISLLASEVLLVIVIVRTSPPRKAAIAIGVVILIATQWWFVLHVYTMITWSIVGFAP